MREFTIILPSAVLKATRNLEKRLLDAFGGYTHHTAVGAWRNPEGKVIYDDNDVFTVAAFNAHENELREIAATAGKEARQETVYLRMPSGEVELVSCGALNVLSTIEEVL